MSTRVLAKEIRTSGSWGCRLSSLVVVAAKLEGDDPVGLSDLLDSWLAVLPGVLLWLVGSIRSAGGQTDATRCVQGPQTHTLDFPLPICPVSSKVRYGDRVAETEHMHRGVELF